MEMLAITNLTKRYGDKEVLRGVDLSVPQGSVFGFIGKNGAGKTTTMKAILGLIRADGGEITVDGTRVAFGQNRLGSRIGYLPDVPAFYSFMTAREYLVLCGEALGMPRKDVMSRSEMLLSLVGLEGERHRIRGFSRGMMQRLGIAQALLGSPKLLICDEPTSALDPVGRKEILDLLLAVKEQTTVLFSTHILSDVERICTDAAFLHDGKIVMQGRVADLKAMHSTKEYRVELTEPSDVDRIADAFADAKRTEDGAVLFTGGEEEMFALLSFLAEQRIRTERIERLETTLESLFMEVVK